MYYITKTQTFSQTEHTHDPTTDQPQHADWHMGVFIYQIFLVL